VTHVDARGLKCPWPALRLAKAMRSADAVTIEADDPAAPREIQALAAAQNWAVTREGAIFHVISVANLGKP
jgi:tRNA 2-thiouridine synthesizing protein A